MHVICSIKNYYLINRIKKLKAKHFQNIYDGGWTDLRLLCIHGKSDIINNIHGLQLTHFLNEDSIGRTELFELCKGGMSHIIQGISGIYSITTDQCKSYSVQSYLTKIGIFD